MSTLMGGQAEGTEDMFAKLESMRAVITEVNMQFKDPVCCFLPSCRSMLSDTELRGVLSSCG